MQIQRGRRGVAPPTLNIGIKKRWVVRERPRLFHPRKENPVPIVREIEWGFGPIWMS